MISKNQVKLLHSLRMKKFRDMNRAFIVEGVKLVDELLASQFGIARIFGTSGWMSSRKELLESRRIDCQVVTDSELHKASGLTTPNEVIALATMPAEDIPGWEKFGSILLVMDRIRDPGNLGTIIRTADWFGIRHIVCSVDTADIYNPKVIQATMGSVFRVSVNYLDLKDFLNTAPDNWNIYAATAGGTDIYSISLRFPAAIVIGNESRGISPELSDGAFAKLAIPSFSGGPESLNASVATAIICSEFTRRMNYSKPENENPGT